MLVYTNIVRNRYQKTRQDVPKQALEGYQFVDAVTSVGEGDWDTSVEGDDGDPKLPWDNLNLSAERAVKLATKVYEKRFGSGWHVIQPRLTKTDRLVLLAGHVLIGDKPVRHICRPYS